jgi:phosphoribosylformylglycinamidine (FGAM) synthase-like enzyme
LLIVSAFAPVADVRRTLTPQVPGTRHRALLLDLGNGRNRLGGSCWRRCSMSGGAPPDVDDAGRPTFMAYCCPGPRICCSAITTGRWRLFVTLCGPSPIAPG